MKKKKSVSSRDVAERAGVSQATVSYVLNNAEGVKIKAETKEAVLKAVEELNYHPNILAKGMKLNRSMSIGIVTDRNLTNFYFMKTLEGIKEGIQEQNYSIILIFNKHEKAEKAEYVKYYESNRIEGIIFAFASIDDETITYLNERNIPFVIADITPKEAKVYQVCTDHMEKIFTGVMAFKDRGAKNIGYTGPRIISGTDVRTKYFLESARKAGYDVGADNLAYSSFDDREMLNSIKELLLSEIDCLIAGAPKFGMIALKCALIMQKKIPEELKIIALGSSQFFDITHPSISSIEVPLFEMGRVSAEKLFDIITGKQTEKLTVMPSELVIRETC